MRGHIRTFLIFSSRKCPKNVGYSSKKNYPKYVDTDEESLNDETLNDTFFKGLISLKFHMGSVKLYVRSPPKKHKRTLSMLAYFAQAT